MSEIHFPQDESSSIVPGTATSASSDHNFQHIVVSSFTSPEDSAGASTTPSSIIAPSPVRAQYLRQPSIIKEEEEFVLESSDAFINTSLKRTAWDRLECPSKYIDTNLTFEKAFKLITDSVELKEFKGKLISALVVVSENLNLKNVSELDLTMVDRRILLSFARIFQDSFFFQTSSFEMSIYLWLLGFLINTFPALETEVIALISTILFSSTLAKYTTLIAQADTIIEHVTDQILENIPNDSCLPAAVIDFITTGVSIGYKKFDSRLFFRFQTFLELLVDPDVFHVYFLPLSVVATIDQLLSLLDVLLIMEPESIKVNPSQMIKLWDRLTQEDLSPCLLLIVFAITSPNTPGMFLSVGTPFIERASRYLLKQAISNDDPYYEIFLDDTLPHSRIETKLIPIVYPQLVLDFLTGKRDTNRIKLFYRLGINEKFFEQEFAKSITVALPSLTEVQRQSVKSPSPLSILKDLYNVVGEAGKRLLLQIGQRLNLDLEHIPEFDSERLSGLGTRARAEIMAIFCDFLTFVNGLSHKSPINHLFLASEGFYKFSLDNRKLIVDNMEEYRCLFNLVNDFNCVELADGKVIEECTYFLLSIAVSIAYSSPRSLKPIMPTIVDMFFAHHKFNDTISDIIVEACDVRLLNGLKFFKRYVYLIETYENKEFVEIASVLHKFCSKKFEELMTKTQFANAYVSKTCHVLEEVDLANIDPTMMNFASLVLEDVKFFARTEQSINADEASAVLLFIALLIIQPPEGCSLSVTSLFEIMELMNISLKTVLEVPQIKCLYAMYVMASKRMPSLCKGDDELFKWIFDALQFNTWVLGMSVSKMEDYFNVVEDIIYRMNSLYRMEEIEPLLQHLCALFKALVDDIQYKDRIYQLIALICGEDEHLIEIGRKADLILAPVKTSEIAEQMTVHADVNKHAKFEEEDVPDTPKVVVKKAPTLPEKEGWIDKRGGFFVFQRWKRRWLSLKNGIITWSETQKTEPIKRIYLSRFLGHSVRLLSNATAQDRYMSDNVIELVIPNLRVFPLSLDNEEELDEWFEKIFKTINNNPEPPKDLDVEGLLM
ncbi:hypothetical protein PCE1_001238 [Barthelona sp. PCE]